MKSIYLKDYNESMGILIDVRHPLEYMKSHDKRSINIYADKLIFDHKKLLDKNKTYYIMCKAGYLSRKVVSNLSFLGYNVVQVLA